MESFRKELEELINRNSLENGSDTPDFILADYLIGCLQIFDKTLEAREKWYNRNIRRNLKCDTELDDKIYKLREKMSHYYVKTKFNTEGSYGSTEEHVLYALHNNSSDYVTFYDETGDIIMVVPDTMDNNLLDAINRLYMPFTNGDDNKLKENVERMNVDDIRQGNL